LLGIFSRGYRDVGGGGKSQLDFFVVLGQYIMPTKGLLGCVTATSFFLLVLGRILFGMAALMAMAGKP
jgi:hypothetical protein